MHKIFHLDCGRQYFTKEWIVALTNELAAAGYNQLQLAFGNNGMRFILDDMAVENYSSEQVKKAVETGNAVYSDKNITEADSLTEYEMDEIFAAADAKGIQIVPLLNTPGHMNALVTAMAELGISNPGYHGSESSVDFENADAVAFVKGLIQKYAEYFAKKGCGFFNIGADEYANDVFESYPGMGFGKLTDSGEYEKFVNYVNELCDILDRAGMTPWAFNDGIYYNKITEYQFRKNLQVCYWCAGWQGYNLAPASFIEEQGHAMINTNLDYYFVVGKQDGYKKKGIALADGFDNTVFPGSVILDTAGSMFCLWIYHPNKVTNQTVAAEVRLILRIIGGRMCGRDITAENVNTDVIAGGFNADGTICEDSRKSRICML